MSRAFPDPWQPEHDPLNLAVLGKLSEELSEAGQATSRCVVHGINEREPETGKPNREWLEDELADVFATANTAIAHFGLDEARILRRAAQKERHFKDWHALIRRDHRKVG